MDTYVYNNLIMRPFNGVLPIEFPYSTTLDLEEHNVIIGYLHTDLKMNDISEIPAMLVPTIEKLLIKPEFENMQLVSPLHCNNASIKSTADSIIKYFFRDTNIENIRLSKIFTKKGDIFYGGQGMLFDRNMNLLVLYTVTVKGFSTARVIRGIRKGEADISSLNVRVSPKVLEKDDLLKKTIMSKLIPSIVTQKYSVRRNLLREELVPKVIIEDLSKYIIKPSRVDNPVTFINDMKNFLSREDVMKDIINCL